MRANLLCRILIIANFFGAILTHAGEDVIAPAGPPAIVVSGQAGTPLESATGLTAVGSIRSALPSGLRISDSGVLTGTPQCESYTEVMAGLQKLLISIQGETGSGATTRSAASAVTISSPLAATPNPAAPGAAVSFSVAASGNLLSYSWNFGDGTSAKSASGSVTHSFAATGAYQATVTVSDGTNAVVSQTQVTIGDAATRAVAPKAPKVKVPTVKVNPFDTMQATAGAAGLPTSFDLVNHRYSIGYVFAKGKKSKTGSTPDLVAKVPLIYDDSTGTSLSVMVPPFFKKSWSGGSADTFLVTDGVMASAPFTRTSINKLAKSASKTEGLVTISWLRANQTILTNSRALLATPSLSAFIDPKVVTDNDNEAAQLGTTIATLQKLKTTKDKLLGAAAKQSDAFISSMLAAGGKVGDVNFATACKGLLTAMGAAKDSNDTALQAAETAFANALQHAAGTRSAGSRGAISDALKFTVAVLTVTATSVAVVVVATGGGIAAGATVIAATGTAAIIIGVTAAATVATAGAAAVIAGSTGGGSQASANGNMLLHEAQLIAKDTAINYVKENLPGNAVGALAGNIKKISGSSQTIGDLVNAATSINDAKNDLSGLAPQLLKTSGTLTGAIIPSGTSYYFKIVGPATDVVSGTISGTDGFSVSYSGTGTVTSPVIPAGASGVVDTLTATDTTTTTTAVLGSFVF